MIKEILNKSFIGFARNLSEKLHFFNLLALRSMLVSKSTIFLKNRLKTFKTALIQYLLKVLCVCFFFVLACFQVHSFEIDRVILSSDSNPIYLEFWPIVAPLWEAMGIKPTLALVSSEEVEVDASLGDVIRFFPINGIVPGMQPQLIRLLVPVLFPDEVCLVSDIDMLPLSPSYFFEGAQECSDRAFLVYRDKGYGEDSSRYPMCYVAAKGRTFASAFRVFSKKDIDTFILWANSLNLGWFTDEILLNYCVGEWEKRGRDVVRLGHTVERRLDREDWEKIDFEKFDVREYIDCHCPRPYHSYKETIDCVVRATQNNLNASK